ncbi:MAG: hypothetical protein C4522_03380 [Desulfobacteraceae bacterium]|nr:MAG: hypothetical protein C4522_03380 [Desulfobacteraceae bacterium]
MSLHRFWGRPVTLQNQRFRNRDDIFLFLKHYFIKEFEIQEDRFLPEISLYEDLSLDSIDAFNIAGMIEVETDIEITDDDLKKIITIQDIVDHMARQLELDPSSVSSFGQLR